MAKARRWFVSDLHFDDSRFDLFYRPFTNLKEQHDTIIKNWNEIVGQDDEVYVVGDVSVTDEGLKYVDKLNGKKTLIMGNYDDPRDIKILQSKFDTIVTRLGMYLDGNELFLTHYPEKAKPNVFNIVGHIHSLWKVQRNMINVSVDAWNFKPVSEEQIIFCINAIKKHYDVNVFAGELDSNIPFAVIHSTDKIKIHGPSVFLAGPTPRNAHTPSWRPEFIQKMQDAGFKGTILTPETKVYNPEYDYDKQVGWEDEGLNKADIIVFWVPRELKEMPGFTTNVEFGEWMKSDKVILGYPKNAEKMAYLHYKATKFGLPVFHEMEDVINEVIKRK